MLIRSMLVTPKLRYVTLTSEKVARLPVSDDQWTIGQLSLLGTGS